MKPLSSDKINTKAQAILKAKNRGTILATEDGNLFWPEAQGYANSHARKLGSIEGYEGTITTIKASKSEAKAEPKAEDAPKAESKPKGKAKGKGKKGK